MQHLHLGKFPVVRPACSQLPQEIDHCCVDLWRTREKAHFLRDALVRASHANDLSDPNNINATAG
mgnify:CR=1 FL=1